MTEETKNSIWGFITKFSKDLTSVAAAVSLLCGIIYYMFSDSIDAVRALPQKVDNIAEILEKNNIGAHPPFIEFRAAQAIPFTVQQGSTISFVYELRRNARCAVNEMHVRFWDVNKGSFVTILYKWDLVVANLTTDFGLFKVTYKIPNDFPVGVFVYYPEIKCNERVINAMPAFFEVTEREDF
jgi:hypothetical protein